jgi:uncharacterized protein (UPF0261 family)
MQKVIALAGTLDTKGEDFAFVRDLIRGLGIGTLTIHTGVYKPGFEPDVSNAEVAAAAGVDIDTLAAGERSEATAAMAKGMEKLLPALYREGRFDAVLSLGGSGGTSIVAPGMRALPIGVPKMIVSTLAGGDVSVYVGESDIFMYPSIVDVAGLNSISVKIYTNAAFAIAGMVKFESEAQPAHKPLIAATMFGVTTPCVTAAKAYLEKEGYEVVIFHAVGTGGRSMEALISAGFFKGVLDLTTTEWCDELFGGVLSAGPHRLEAAGRKGVPQVVSVGALDMVNFGAFDTVPEKYKGRNLYRHNPTVTLMRTTPEENAVLGEMIAKKLNAAAGPTTLILPLKGVSMLDKEGGAFFGEAEDKALFGALRAKVDRAKVEVVELENNINDEAFAVAAAKKLLELMK